MDESAPITWLIGEINKIVSSGAGATASAIATAVAASLPMALPALAAATVGTTTL